MMTKGQKGFFSSNHIRPNVFLSMDELERHLRVHIFEADRNINVIFDVLFDKILLSTQSTQF